MLIPRPIPVGARALGKRRVIQSYLSDPYIYQTRSIAAKTFFANRARARFLIAPRCGKKHCSNTGVNQGE